MQILSGLKMSDSSSQRPPDAYTTVRARLPFCRLTSLVDRAGYVCAEKIKAYSG